MRDNDSKGLRRISRALVTACAAALLIATPLAASARWREATPAQAAPRDEVRPAADKQDAVQWADFSVEVYGKLVSRSGKVATLLPLVSTTATPVAAGTKAVLFGRVDDPGGPKATKWVEIARVTMKKIESTGNMQLTIDTESSLPAPTGKVPGNFVKGARLKLAIQ